MPVECFQIYHNLSYSLHFIVQETPTLLTLHILPVIRYYVGQGSMHNLGMKPLQAEPYNLSSSSGLFELHLNTHHASMRSGKWRWGNIVCLLDLSQWSMGIISNCSGICCWNMLQLVIQTVWSSERAECQLSLLLPKCSYKYIELHSVTFQRP